MYREIDLNDWILTGGGAQGETYFSKKDDSLLLKVYKSASSSQVERLYRMSAFALEKGIPTPKAYEIVTVQGKSGILFERINGKVSLFRMIKEDPSKIDFAVNEFVKILKLIHSQKSDPKVVMSRSSYLEMCYHYLTRDHKTMTEEQKKEILDLCLSKIHRLNVDADDTSLLMGDCHLGNVVYADGKSYLIDLDLNSGDSFFDEAHFYAALIHEDNRDSVSEKKRYDLASKPLIWNAFVKAYYGDITNKELQEKITRFETYEILQKMLAEMYFQKPYEELKKHLMEA